MDVKIMEDAGAYALLRRGSELLEEGNPAQAALVLERARLAEPRKGSILEMLGRAYYRCGRFAAAAAGFEEALEVDPTNDYAHYCLGLCLLKMRRNETAAGHFKMAWTLRPSEVYQEKAARFGAAGASDAGPATGSSRGT